MRFGKLVGNRYTAAAFAGGAMVGLYDAATQGSQQRSMGQIASDVAAGALIGIGGVKAHEMGSKYLSQFNGLGAMAETVANRVSKTSIDQIVERAKNLPAHLADPSVATAAIFGGLEGTALSVAQGGDLGDHARAAGVGAVVGVGGYKARKKFLSQQDDIVAKSIEAPTLAKGLKNPQLLSTLGTAAAIGAAEGVINARFGRNDGNLFNGALAGTLMGVEDVVGVMAIAAGARQMGKLGIFNSQKAKLSFSEALELRANPIQAIKSTMDTGKDIKHWVSSGEAKRRAESLKKETGSKLKEGLKRAQSFGKSAP